MRIARRGPDRTLAGIVVLASALAACGTRTEPERGVEAPVDASALDAADAIPEATPEAMPDAGSACPARRPRANEGCDVSLEGLECAYGSACRSGCVCERGSWICLRDTCSETCPALVPFGLPCDPAQIDRACDYPKGCPSSCTCDPVDGGARWRCLGPPC